MSTPLRLSSFSEGTPKLQLMPLYQEGMSVRCQTQRIAKYAYAPSSYSLPKTRFEYWNHCQLGRGVWEDVKLYESGKGFRVYPIIKKTESKVEQGE